ncbi:MAG: DNA methyltransferase [Pseudomonadota bacterium]
MGTTDIQTIVKHNVRLDRIHYRAIDALRMYERKLRKRSIRAETALRNSVATFGIVLPILVDHDNLVIGGEGIVEAARQLGYTEVPTIMLDHLDETEKRILRIALNKLSEGGEWEDKELGLEFLELSKIELDVGVEISGFSSIEIDNLIHPPADPDGDDTDPDDEYEQVGAGPAITRLGDLWHAGQHRVLCGSSLEKDNLALLMGGHRAQMVFSDSPWNVKVNGHVSVAGKHKRREFAQASGEMTEDEFVDFQKVSTAMLAEFCHDGALLYLCIDWRHVWEMMLGIRAADLKLVNLAVWVKHSPGMGSLYRSQHELVFIAKKGSAPSQNNVELGKHGRSRSNCWFYPGMAGFSADRDEQLASHPTPKNVVMVKDAIRDVTNRGDIVLDGFLGSGTTLIAAERTGRVCYGIDLDPLYVDGIIRRWEKATGEQATLSTTGQTFEEVAAERAADVEMPRPDIVVRERKRALA